MMVFLKRRWILLACMFVIGADFTAVAGEAKGGEGNDRNNESVLVNGDMLRPGRYSLAREIVPSTVAAIAGGMRNPAKKPWVIEQWRKVGGTVVRIHRYKGTEMDTRFMKLQAGDYIAVIALNFSW